MRIESVSSVVTASFLQRIGANDPTAAPSVIAGLSSSQKLEFTRDGLSQGVRVFTSSILGLNSLLNTINITRDDLFELRELTDEMISVVRGATLSGIGSAQRGSFNSSFQGLARQFTEVLAASARRDVKSLDSADIERVFGVLGFTRDQSQTFAELLTRFRFEENSSGDNTLATDRSLSPRPVQIPANAYNTTVIADTSTGTGTFSQTRSTWAASLYGYRDIATSDVNDDGNQDILSLNEYGFFSVQLGNGNGTFQAARTYYQQGLSEPLSPLDFAIGDINGDGREDVVFGGSGSSESIFTFLGNADGSFSSGTVATPFRVGGSTSTTIQSMALADVNGDSIRDIIVGGDAGVSVLLGVGDGTFSEALTEQVIGEAIRSIKVGTLDGGTANDLAFATNSAVYRMLGNNDGTFGTAVSWAHIASSVVEDFDLADLNGDGDLDLVVPISSTGQVQVRFNNSLGSFATNFVLPTGATADTRSASFADTNNDGFLDIVALNNDTNSISVFTGNGTGFFSATAKVSDTNFAPRNMAFGDFDEDGVIDLAIGGNNDTVGVFRGVPETTLATVQSNFSRDFRFLFEAERNILTRPQAFRMLKDLEALGEQLDTNIRAVGEAQRFILDNIELIRASALAFNRVTASLSQDPTQDPQEIAQRVQQSIRSLASPTSLRQLANLDPLTVATMTGNTET